MRLIDADRLLEDKRIEKYYHLKNGDIAIPLIDIKHAPTIEERKKGKWIKDEEASSHHVETIYVCSACNNMDAWGEVEKNTFKFCPNCGAEMRGESDG